MPRNPPGTDPFGYNEPPPDENPPEPPPRPPKPDEPDEKAWMLHALVTVSQAWQGGSLKSLAEAMQTIEHVLDQVHPVRKILREGR